jgi:putative Mn2+ efflux pump MntP
MSYLTILGIAVGLSMDSLAISIIYGCILSRMRLKNILIIASSLSLFQAFMPVIGWNVGMLFEVMIRSFGHWVAFILLSTTGLKMIIDGIKPSSETTGYCTEDDHINYRKLIILSIATSIDALAVGLSLSAINYHISSPAVIIGTTTFIFSLTGIMMGSTLQRLIGKRVEIFGGAILIFMGMKVIFDYFTG